MFLLTFVFFVIPLADEYFEYDLRNPTKEEESEMSTQLRFKFPLYVCIFCDWFLSFYLVNYFLHNDLHVFHQAAILFGAAIFSATNINSSHELVHKLDDPLDLFLGTATLLKNFYMHFAIEHVWGHHKNVATPIDPATSKKGQSLYAFFIQTIIGSWKSAWKIEYHRLKEKKIRVVSAGNKQVSRENNNSSSTNSNDSTGNNNNTNQSKNINNSMSSNSNDTKQQQQNYSFYSLDFLLHNKMVWFTTIQLLFALYLQRNYGWWGLYYFFILGFGGGIVLEVVNYIEHYGLQRKEVAPGVYEKVSVEHSWNAPHRLTNYFLFKLQRHSDHHANPLKPYQILNSDEKSPTLPQGYAACVIIALFPKLWFNIMDEVLERYKNKQITEEFEKITRIKIQIYIFCIGSCLAFLTWWSSSLRH